MSYRLGLTGSIATGKSTVSRHFKSLGFPVVDADQATRAVQEPGEAGLEAIRRTFGDDYIFPNGTLNRKKLGNLIFNDEKKREELNLIMQPPIREWIFQKTEDYEASGHELIILDIPLLYEMHYDKDVTAVMVVYVPESIEIDRLMKRDHLSEEEAKQRVSSQMAIEQKVSRADYVIDNSGSTFETTKQVDAWIAVQGFKPLEQDK